MSDIVKHIDRNNFALKYIDQRIESDDYRGAVSSQHNRFTEEELYNTLKSLDKHAPNKSFMQIRTTDLAKRPINSSEEQKFAIFCNEVIKDTGRGTQDTIRKNWFVDFHRMGFIQRYDKNHNPTHAWKRSIPKFVSITPDGAKFIKELDPANRLFLFTKGLNKLLKNYINILLNLLKDDEYNLQHITLNEFMFFASAVVANTEYSLTGSQCVEHINEYRKLTKAQRISVEECLKSKLQPENYAGTKTDQRDFHNWKNKDRQIFSLIAQTAYFEVREEKIFYRHPKNQKQLNRSISQKQKYFKEHSVSKKRGFELHHIIPLSWSENYEHFVLLDKWENMIYIDGYSHAQITQNRNKNIVLSKGVNGLILQDYESNIVNLEKDINVLYNEDKEPIMLSYNDTLIRGYK